MARPTKLTPEIQKNICDCLRSGCYAVTACARAGITESTYYLWLRKGAAGQQPYSQFSESVKKADADAEALLAGTVMRVALAPENPNWQAAMTMLERRHPERWGRRERVRAELSADLKLDAEVNAQVVMDSPDRCAEVLRILAEVGAFDAALADLDRAAEADSRALPDSSALAPS